MKIAKKNSDFLRIFKMWGHCLTRKQETTGSSTPCACSDDLYRKERHTSVGKFSAGTAFRLGMPRPRPDWQIHGLTIHKWTQRFPDLTYILHYPTQAWHAREWCMYDTMRHHIFWHIANEVYTTVEDSRSCLQDRSRTEHESKLQYLLAMDRQSLGSSIYWKDLQKRCQVTNTWILWTTMIQISPGLLLPRTLYRQISWLYCSTILY